MFNIASPSIENREIYAMAKYEGICISYMGQSHEQLNNVLSGNHSQYIVYESFWEGVGIDYNPQFPDWFFTHRGETLCAAFSLI